MKQIAIGSAILLSMLGILALFPLTAGFLGSGVHTIDVNAGKTDLWFLKNEKAKVVLVYFGYVGCTSVCIPALNELSPLYREMRQQTDDVSFYFVNLNPTQDPSWAEPFARSFHPEFRGVYADIVQVTRLEKEFNLAVAGDEEMSHSSNLYMLVRSGSGYELKRIYTTHPYPSSALLEDLKRYAL